MDIKKLEQLIRVSATSIDENYIKSLLLLYRFIAQFKKLAQGDFSNIKSDAG